MTTRKKATEQHEVAHEIGDGFVVAWDTYAVAVEPRDELHDAASSQIERLGSNLVSIKPRPRRRRRARPQAA